MHEIIDYKEALKKVQRIETNDEWVPSCIDKWLEERSEMMQRSIRELTIKFFDMWCTNCMSEEHTKDNYKHKELMDIHYYVKVLHFECFYRICITNHTAWDYLHNFKISKIRSCSIYEEAT